MKNDNLEFINKKSYKIFVLISSLLCLLPIIFGYLNYDKLPNSIPTHFDFYGNANGYTPKNIFVYLMPIGFCILNLISGILMIYDPFDKKSINKNPFLVKLMILIIPVLTNIMFIVSYRACFNMKTYVNKIVPLFIGILFIVVGNYMPKNKLNSLIGIKNPYTLKSEYIWNKTNRLGGYLFIVGGFLMIISIFIKKAIFIKLIISISILILFLPTVYSFYLYKKSIK